MEQNTLLLIACAILYALLVWRFYDGLNAILPHSHGLNAFTSIFWPGFIVVILAMLVFVIIVAIVVAIFLGGAFAIDLIRAMFKGKPIKEYVPEDEEEEDTGEEDAE